MEHKSEIKDKKHARYLEDKERINKKGREHYETHKDAYRAYSKEYRATHKEEIRAMYEAYYASNKDTYVEKAKDWKRKNPYRAWASGTIKGHERKGYVVSVTVDDLAEHATMITHCPICDCELAWGPKGAHKPNSPTWDRKFNGKRLTMANTWIICFRCNSMKLDMPLPELKEWCQKVISRF